MVTERHRYNLETVDGKVKQKEFVVASPEQQQVIASFAASRTKRHLVLEGPAGTGKTFVAMQVANDLLEFSKTSDIEPQLVVTIGLLALGGHKTTALLSWRISTPPWEQR